MASDRGGEQSLVTGLRHGAPASPSGDADAMTLLRLAMLLGLGVGSHVGVRIWNFDPKKPSNVRIPTNYILTLDGSAGGLKFKRRRLV